MLAIYKIFETWQRTMVKENISLADKKPAKVLRPECRSLMKFSVRIITKRKTNRLCVHVYTRALEKMKKEW